MLNTRYHEYCIDTNAIRLALVYMHILRVAQHNKAAKIEKLTQERISTISKQAYLVYTQGATVDECIGAELLSYIHKADPTFKDIFEI